MAHHKRKRPKNRRAGCLLCKAHKANGSKHRQSPAVQRAMQDDFRLIVKTIIVETQEKLEAYREVLTPP